MAGAILVTGGQRSGKSRYAEKLALATCRTPVYVATATAGDAEMAARIAAHRQRRGAFWQTVEEPLDLAGVLGAVASAGHAVVVDCLTLWLSNLIHAGQDPDAETDRLIDVLGQAEGTIVLVSNEVGSGIIPDNALARRFADAQGTLNQRIAEAAETVVLMAAGLPLRLKPATGIDP